MAEPDPKEVWADKNEWIMAQRNSAAKARKSARRVLGNRKKQDSKPNALPPSNPQVLMEEGVVMNDKGRVLDALKLGAKLDVPGCRGLTPLNDAVDRNNCEMVILLIRLGANVNQRDENGATALEHAICDRSWDLVACLIGLKAEVNNVNDAEETPLMEALSCHAPFTIIRALLDAGADPFYKSSNTGETALELAFYDERAEVRMLFQDLPDESLGNDEYGERTNDEYVEEGVMQKPAFRDPRKFLN